jgi:CheY-like chemotaxis protein
VPRILVADDNSNIHRTVALALKETGVEVVAVGNGEAAVRKIAEIKPDLVLADIFMPVRSGYEVCEFVKQDPRFAGMPVVLLIGAFDPFDEREAQRVQADAILKKPFVPPDSLLRTVTDLLAQSASRAGATAAAPAVAQTARPSAPEPPKQAPVQEYMDAPPEEFEPAKARLEWDSDDQPVAFGTLLETPSAESPTAEPTAASDDSVMTAHRDPNLGEPAFWAPKAHAENEQDASETEEAPAESSPVFGDEEQWRSGSVLDGLPKQMEAAPDGTQIESLLDLPDTVAELPGTTQSVGKFIEASVEPLPQDSVLELPEFPPLHVPPPKNSTPVPALDSLAEPKAPVTAASSKKVEEPLEIPQAGQDSVPDLNDFSWAAPGRLEEATPEPEPVAEIDAPADEKEAIDSAAPGLATLAPFLAGLTSAASTRNPQEAPEVFEFDSTALLPADFAAESPELESAESLDSPIASRLDPMVIEAIAQRVIERMQPKIIELVTRELLRPAVEALVQRELDKK